MLFHIVIVVVSVGSLVVVDVSTFLLVKEGGGGCRTIDICR